MILKKFTQLKEINPDNREIIGVASSEVEDRDGEVIRQSGINFKNFLKTNPIMLANHDGGDIRSVIGKVTDIWREGNKTLFKAQFSKASDLANQAYEMVKEGILNTFSIGFVAKSFDDDNKTISESELLEISLVPIPSNPEALVMAKGLKENDFAKKTVELWKEKKIETQIKQMNEDTKKEVMGILNGIKQGADTVMDLLGTTDEMEEEKSLEKDFYKKLINNLKK